MSITSDMEHVAQALDGGSTPSITPAESPTGPSDVELPVGRLGESGPEYTAEVRELNGFDEEAVMRTRTMGTVLQKVLERAVIRIGDSKPTPAVLREIAQADRMYLLLQIRNLTWGPEYKRSVTCWHCSEEVDLEFDLSSVDVGRLRDHLADRFYEISLPDGTVARATYVSGRVHEKVLLGAIENDAQMVSEVLLDCVQEIDGQPIFDMSNVRALPLRVRQELIKGVDSRALGPKLTGLKKPCPQCGGELEVSLPIGDLFLF